MIRRPLLTSKQPVSRAVLVLQLLALLWAVSFPAISAASPDTPVAPPKESLSHDSNPSTTNPADSSKAISVTDYRARLQSLDQILAACQQVMNQANCKSDQVGADVQVALPSGPRQIRFGWLRGLLDAAAKGEKDQAAADKASGAKPKPVGPETSTQDQPEYIPPTLAKRLEEARKRLAEDEQFADQATGQPGPAGRTNAGPTANAVQSVGTQRQRLTSILAAKEYHAAVAGPTIRDRIMEKLANWLNRAFSKLAEAGAKSRWIGLTAEIGFGVLFCVVLVWFLIRLERQGRFSPMMIRSGPGLGAASARDWQLWLADARQAAAQGAWRDAIHLLYWASISRLESGGLWPSDRARTPREYLALLSRESEQRPDLSALTRSFERTWYAGRPAVEADYRQAEQLASRLGAQ